MKKTVFSAVLAVIMLIVLAGCSGNSPAASVSPSPTEASSATPTATPDNTVTVNVTGADYIADVMTLLGDNYNGMNAGVTVSVASTSSNTGIAKCADGKADIGLASRELKEAEKAAFTDMNVVNLCMDGIVIITATENPVKNLSAEQVKGIFTGEITDWGDVGGTAGYINVYTLSSSTEVRSVFDKLFLGTDENGNTIDTDDSVFTAVSSYDDMITSVGAGADSIGYLPLSALIGDVKALTVNNIRASSTSITDGSYPYFMNFYILTTKPSNEAQAFLTYCTGSDASQVLKDMGFIVPGA